MADRFIDYVALGKKIRKKRLNTGMSQDTASEGVGMSESFYGHIERGTKILSLESLLKVANYFNFSLDYLLSDSLKSADSDDKFQAELDNVFRDKTPAQRDYLLKILKMFSNDIDNLQP